MPPLSWEQRDWGSSRTAEAPSDQNNQNNVDAARTVYGKIDDHHDENHNKKEDWAKSGNANDDDNYDDEGNWNPKPKTYAPIHDSS